MFLSVMTFAVCLSAFIVYICTYFIVPLCMRYAIQCNIVDLPDGKLKQHAQVTPYLGGVAVFGGLSTGFVIVSMLLNSTPALKDIFCYAPFIVGISILLILGLIDDIRVLSPQQKILWQLGAACLISMSGGTVSHETTLLLHAWGFPAILATITGMLLEIIFIISMMNAFNLIDIMDGLATTTAIGSSIILGAAALHAQSYDIAIFLSMYIAALLAFLYYNWPRARIYLGDSGSLVMGGFLAGMACQVTWHIPSATPFASFFLMTFILIAVFFIPFIELIMLVVIRTHKGLPFFLGSPHHFIHYLKRRGFSIFCILKMVYFLSIYLLLNVIALLFNVYSLGQYAAVMITAMSAWIAFVYLFSFKKIVMKS